MIITNKRLRDIRIVNVELNEEIDNFSIPMIDENLEQNCSYIHKYIYCLLNPQKQGNGQENGYEDDF